MWWYLEMGAFAWQWGYEGGALMIELVPLWGETPEHASSLLSAKWGHRKKTAIQERGRRSSAKHSGTLISDFQTPESLWERDACCWSHPVNANLFQQPGLRHRQSCYVFFLNMILVICPFPDSSPPWPSSTPCAHVFRVSPKISFSGCLTALFALTGTKAVGTLLSLLCVVSVNGGGWEHRSDTVSQIALKLKPSSTILSLRDLKHIILLPQDSVPSFVKWG